MRDETSSLAYAELYLTVAVLFRRLEFRIHGTANTDLEWDGNVIMTTKGALDGYCQGVGGEVDVVLVRLMAGTGKLR
jgi:hypothetical protein